MVGRKSHFLTLLICTRAVGRISTSPLNHVKTGAGLPWLALHSRLQLPPTTTDMVDRSGVSWTPLGRLAVELKIDNINRVHAIQRLNVIAIIDWIRLRWLIGATRITIIRDVWKPKSQIDFAAYIAKSELYRTDTKRSHQTFQLSRFFTSQRVCWWVPAYRDFTGCWPIDCGILPGFK